MNAGEHEAVHRDLGVYVLGALEPADRDRLERHLVGCDICRDELASLAVLPSLLTRAAPDAAAIPETPPFGPIVERLATDRRRARRRTRVVAVAGVAAMVTLVAVLVLPGGGPTPVGQPYVSDVAGVTASVQERDWGMAVRIEAAQLPDHPGYAAYAVSDSGHRSQVASWSATGRPVTVEGACYLQAAEVDRMEIVSAPAGEVIAVLRPSRS